MQVLKPRQKTCQPAAWFCPPPPARARPPRTAWRRRGERVSSMASARRWSRIRPRTSPSTRRQSGPPSLARLLPLLRPHRAPAANQYPDGRCYPSQETDAGISEVCWVQDSLGLQAGDERVRSLCRDHARLSATSARWCPMTTALAHQHTLWLTRALLQVRWLRDPGGDGVRELVE